MIANGEFLLDHERVPLELDLPEFRGRLLGRSAGGTAGHLSFEPGRLKVGDGPVLAVGTEIDVIWNRGVVDVQGARLFAENINLAYQGRIRFAGRPQGQLTLEGPVDLAVLERHVFRSGLGFAGLAHWAGLLTIDGSRLRIEGRMQGDAGRFMGTAVPRFASWLSYDGTNGLVMRDLDVETLGGSARLAIDVPPTATGRPVSIRGTVDKADGEGVLRMLFGWGALGIGTAATGELDVSWPKGRTRSISGSLGVDLAPVEDGRFAFGGRFDWRAKDGQPALRAAGAHRSPRQRARDGRGGRARPRAARAGGRHGNDIAGLETLLTRCRRALGNAEAQPAGVQRQGALPRALGRDARLADHRGPLRERSARLLGDRVGRGGLDRQLRHGRGSGRIASAAAAQGREPDRLGRPHRDRLVRRAGRGRGARAGRGLAARGPDRLHGLEPASERPRHRQRSRRRPPQCSGGRGRGHRSCRKLLRSRLRRGAASSRAGRREGSRSGAARPGSGAAASASRAACRTTASTTARARWKTSSLRRCRSRPRPRPSPAASPGSLLWQGTLGHPRLVATLSSPRLFFGDEGIGALEARLTGDGDGRVTLDGRCRSGRLDLALAGDVLAAGPHQADLTLRARDTSVDPFVRAVLPGLPQGVALVATGEARIQGPLARPAELAAVATLHELELLTADFPVRASEPVRLALAGGRLELGRLHLAGEGTDLVVEGAMDAFGDGPLALEARGRADLRGLAGLTRRLRGQGDARLAVSVSGTRAAPLVRGALDLEGAGLRVRGFPHGVEALRGRVRFSERAAELENVHGTLAGGALDVEGQVAYAGGRLTSYDIRPTGKGLALRYPEGLRSLLDAELRLFGDADQQWITGTLDVRQALYTRRYDVASELLALRRTLPVPQTTQQAGARLDLRLRAPGTLRIDNNLATLQARAELALQGTIEAPLVTGRAEIERGRLYFQGHTYVVQRGVLDFVNPQRLDPLFDIEAQTRLRSYQVTLRVSGTLERVTPTLTSDPPLSSLQILALLAGQEESEVANLTQSQARESQGQLARAGAATLAAGRISESMGLEREAERLFGLNRFSIDPSLLRGAGTSTARVTVGKRLTPDLNVLYSQDLRGTEERILAVEYTLTDRFSLLLTRTDPGTGKTGTERGWAFDVRIRQSR